MEEKILQKIKEALGQTSLSDRTLNEGAVKFLTQSITTDEQLTDEAIAPYVQMLKVLDGQLNHDVAEKLKQQPPAPKPKPVEPPKPEPPKYELPKEIMEELEASRKFRQDYLKQQETLKLQAAKDKLFKDVKEALSKAGCKDELMMRITMPQIDYGKSIEDNVATLKEVYNTELSNYVSKQGYIPSTQSQQTPTAKTQEEIATEQRARAEEFKKQGLTN